MSDPVAPLLQPAAYYQQMIAAMPVAVIVLNGHGYVAEANAEAVRLLGEPLCGERWLDIIQRCFAPQKDDGHEVSLRDGRRVRVALSATDAGQLILITDLTDSRLLQARVSKQQQLSSLGQILASVAHQLHAPLSSALLYAEELQSAALQPEQRQRFQRKLYERLQELSAQAQDMRRFCRQNPLSSNSSSSNNSEQYGTELTFECASQPVIHDARSCHLYTLAEKVAATDATVMIQGPSGVGKEVLARFIHQHSPRAGAPFVAINCAAIPDHMLEATLFGYEKGAFTGAVQACPGKFEQAQGGTLLLDEISEMALSLQAKLLRVLQEREVERLGGRKTISLNVRVLATSNRQLLDAVRQGEFREDLYYRLNVFPLHLSALRERPDDIIPLAHYLLARHAARDYQLTGRSTLPRLTADAAQLLRRYRWPGNVRELDNVMQRALILSASDEIGVHDILLEPEQCQTAMTPSLSESSPAVSHAEQDALSAALPEAGLDPAISATSAATLDGDLRLQEANLILQALHACDGRRLETAERLGISPRTLRYKLARMRDSGIAIPQ